MKKLLLILLLGFTFATAAISADEPLRPVIINQTLTSANTEYSVSIPNGAGSITIQSRTAADFKMGITSGQSGTTYFTIKAGTAYYETRVSSYNATLYFQSTTAGQIVEIIYWI